MARIRQVREQAPAVTPDEVTDTGNSENTDNTPRSSETSDDFKEAHATYERLHVEIGKSVYMSHENILGIVGAIAVGGHLLEKGTYGIGKTTTAKAIAEMIGGSFNRIQGGPDIMASDITGSDEYKQDTQTWVFKPGAVFANMLLADELHRMPSKAQSGLVESMQEGQVTVGDTTRKLPEPHLLIATINPDGEEVAPVILDRFVGSLNLPKQDAATRKKVMAVKMAGHKTRHVASEDQIMNLRNVVANEVEIDSDDLDRANTLIDRVYEDPRVDHEESIEGTFRHFENIVNIAKFVALASGENGSRIVRPSHIAIAAPFVLAHRIVPTYEEIETKGTSSLDIINSAVARHFNLSQTK